ncbi:hypothetical protein JOQ06_011967 [Pogonophryne albipinna]|uniref:C2H2-type domain-containing protein n=1 Tax=Pogonophryne albipinna TaxID=1090488 RepID=A0AAD6FNN7_9TELE|nr:hypothetical protein JOQ06_011967 [Pogonophryne albipinna]
MHNLMGHMHLHSDSKPFKCLYCPSKFTLKGNLTRHMKVKHGVMDRGLDERLFRQRGRFCVSTPMGLLTRFSQEEPFDLSQKPPGLPSLHLSQSDGESVPGSSCQEEDEESLYRRSQYSPDVDRHEQAGSDRYIPELEERGQGSPAELRPGEKHEETYQHSSDGQTYEKDSATEEGEQVQLLQSEETSEMAYESDVSDQEYHNETGCTQLYDYNSDSEIENGLDSSTELDEAEQGKQQNAIDAAGRRQVK